MSRGIIELAIAAAMLVILPNAVFWLIAGLFGIDRAPFNLEYFLVGVLFAARRRRLAGILLIVFMLFDLLSLAGLLFPFVRIQDVTYLLGLLPHAAPIWQISALSLVLVVGGVAYVLYAHGHKAKLGSALVLLNAALLIYGVGVYTNDRTQGRFYRDRGTLVESQSLAFINNRSTQFTEAFQASGDPLIPTGFKGQTARWVEAEPAALNGKLLLVIAESWGSMKDERIQKAVVSPLLSLSHRFDWLKEGEMFADTATVGAELRELCGLATHHYNLKAVTEGFSGCLPSKLRRQGYATSAIHGSAGVMYDRVYWYPRAGFEEMRFKETGDWTSQCYSFPGACDWEIMDRTIANAFTAGGKRFVYWLTLNTHSIYDSRDIREDYFDCTAYGLPENGETCRMTKLHAQFFHDLANTLSDDRMRGVEVLIVGDHQPPILNKNELQAHVKEDTVSWVHFRVKD